MLLDVKNLDVSYGDKLTVTGASIELDKGEILSIVGESGSGKTTVIRAIMGCLPGRGHVSGGSITFDGRDMLKNTREDWRKISGSEMSMIFQDSGNMINPIRRIGEQFTDYILAHAPQKSKAEAAEMAKDMLNKVRLPNPQNIMNSYPFELSGGMRKRVAMAQTMIADPDILLMDESFSALDIQTRQLMENELLELWQAKKKAVLFITHDLDEAIAMSDRVVVMSAGPASHPLGSFPIAIPRPRNVAEIRTRADFNECYSAIWEVLREEVLKSYREHRAHVGTLAS